jgi:hypothetical protein
MAVVVKIDRVIPLADIAPSSYGIRKMKSVLLQQGQIEPLQVHKFDEHFIVFHDDPWGCEVVYAARELGWPTLLIAEMKKYEA